MCPCVACSLVTGTGIRVTCPVLGLSGWVSLDTSIFQDLGTPSEKIWPGYNELPAVKKMTFSEYPYNNLRKRFGALLSDQGFDLMNKCVWRGRGRGARPVASLTRHPLPSGS